MKSIVVAFSTAVVLAVCSTADAAVVDLYGASGSFGTHGATIPSGQSLSLNAVAGWQTDPGQGGFFPAVTSDGTVFVANLPQTFSQLWPTACDMAVTCFNPSAAVCRDSITGVAGNFGTIRIPTVGGGTFVPSGGCGTLQGVCTSGTCTSGKVGNSCMTNLECEKRGGGSDISDLEVVPDTGGGQKVVFNSALSSGGPASANSFPMYGAIRKVSGVWGLDTSSLRDPYQFRQSSSAGSQACSATVPMQADCHGVNETVQLPVSGRLAVTEYFGGIMVIDTGGTVLAYYAVPVTPDPCNTSVNLTIAPREVDADPTSTSGDERFVVVYDIFGGTTNSQTMQEFKYDDSTQTITPISAPIYATSGVHPGATCATNQVVTAQFDHKGNLWAARSTGISGGPVGVYLKDSTTGKRKLETGCGASNVYGFLCATDLELGLANITSTATPNWTLPWESHLLEDPTSGTMFVNTFGGQVIPIELSATTDGTPFTALNKIDLGKSRLKPPATAVCSNSPSTTCTANSQCPTGGVCMIERRDGTKTTIDAGNRSLWVPIITSETSGPDGCNFFSCQYQVGVQRDIWLYRVNIDAAQSAAVRATQVQAPTAVTAGLSFTIAVTINMTDAIDTTKSFVAVYLNDSATPTSPIAWGAPSCASGSCTYTASVAASVTTGATGSLVWHAFLANSGSSKAIHTVGSAKINPAACQ